MFSPFRPTAILQPFSTMSDGLSLAALRAKFSADKWYLFDPGASNAVYQDSAGLTPAAANDVVGLMLDSAKDTPEVRRNFIGYSTDLTQGSVSQNSNNNKTANTIVFTSSSGFFYKRLTTGFNIPGTITASIRVKSTDGKGAVGFRVTNGDGTDSSYISIQLTNSYTTYKITKSFSSGTYIEIGLENRTFLGGDGTTTGTVSVEFMQLEIGSVQTEHQQTTDYPTAWTSNAKAIQATTANKPYSRKTSTTNRYWLDGNTSTAALTSTLGNLGSSCTIARCGATGVTWLNSQTISSTLNVVTLYAYNGPVGVWNRALTTSEKRLFEQWYATKKAANDRWNLLVNTEAMDLWTKYKNGTGSLPVVTPNSALAPDGSMTAATVVFDAGSGTTSSDQSSIWCPTTFNAGLTYSGGFYLKGDAGTSVLLKHARTSPYTKITCSGGWDLVSTTETTTADPGLFFIGLRKAQVSGLSQSGTFYIWRPRCNIGSSLLEYQRVDAGYEVYK